MPLNATHPSGASLSNYSHESSITLCLLKPLLYKLNTDDHDEPRQMPISLSLPARDVIRARMILTLAVGRSYAEIPEHLQTAAPTISRWKRPFLSERINELIAAHIPARNRP
jgi:hypothetical protein